ncbi:MAG: ankyrin repeat domain-containing protein [Pirellulaceae bacterium]
MPFVRFHISEQYQSPVPACASSFLAYASGYGVRVLAARLMFVLFSITLSTDALAAEPELADAIEQGHADQALTLLEQGVNVNAAQVDGMTALHWSVWREDVALTERLLAAKAQVNQPNRYGITPLAIACTSGNARLVAQLLEAGADAKAKLRSGETPLMIAGRTGRSEPVKLLIDAGADVDAMDGSGQTAIMWAAAEGHAAVVQQLIQAGADFEQSLESGFNAMMFAVREGHWDAAQVLLQAGSDVNYAMQPKRTGGKHPRRGMSPLLMAVENGHLELAMQLVQAGADVNDQRSGFTALHTLTWVRKPNLGDSADGDPAPEGSGKLTSLDFVRRLAAAGADVNRRMEGGSSGRGKLNHKGATAFLFAARTNDVPLLKVLLELGADSDLRNADNCTPLLAAAGIGTLAPGEEAGTEDEAIETVNFLLDLGADINHVDDNGETAMHGAAYKSLPQVVALLAERGAKIDVWNQKNKYGWTPVLIAEGHRPGNFKPAAETLEAIHRYSSLPPHSTCSHTTQRNQRLRAAVAQTLARTMLETADERLRQIESRASNEPRLDR